MSRIVHLNGQFLAEEEARVSIFDRGFMFADGVYEVTAVINGKLIDYAPHMERLERSLKALDMAWPCSKDELRAVHEDLVKHNDVEQGRVYMQVTRGVAERDFAYPAATPTTLMAFTQIAATIANPKAETGVAAITIPDIRWKRRDIKSIALLAQCMGKQRAAEAGAYEALMVEDGHITEGTSSSAYMVKDGAIITRPLSTAILPGVTRRALLRLAADDHIAVEERLFTPHEVLAADEVFITSASAFVMPVVAVDGRRIGDGKPGAVTRKLRQTYIDAALAAP